jgi:RND family efflux transporter MFP subunit
MFCYLRNHATHRPWRTATAAALLLLLTVAAAYLYAHEGHEPLPMRGARLLKDKQGRVVGVLLSREAREALDLQTAPAGRRRLDRRLLAQASLAAPWQGHAYASSRLAGRIVKLHVAAGEVVRAGQALAEVQSIELEQLQLELLAARTESRLSARMVERLTHGNQGGAVADQTLIDIRTRHRQNLNQLDVARSKLLSLGLNQADLDRLLEADRPMVPSLPVRSPVAGTVIHADLGVGKVVEPAEHLFEVVDLSRVWVRLGVLERDLHRVRLGQEVELALAAYPGEVFRTRLAVQAPHLDARTHLHTAWADLTNSPGREPRFLPGMNGQAHLLVPGDHNSTVVPEEALVHDGVEGYVLVEQARTPDGSELVRTPVVAGTRAGGWAEVLLGNVYPGTHVVTRGSHELASLFVPGVLRPGPEASRDMKLHTEPVGRHVVERITTVEAAVDFPPDRRATLSAPLAGTLDAILVERGQEVSPGQEVARLSSLELRTQQLELLRVHLETRLVESTLGRLKKARGAVPQRLVWETESRLVGLRQQRETSRRKLAALGLSPAQLDDLTERKKLVESLPLRCPIAGRVVTFDRVLGQALKATETIFEVHDARDPLLQAFVAEADLARIRPGQKARVYLSADPAFVGQATLVRTGRVFAADSRTLSAWLRLDRAPARPLLHGQLARIVLVQGAAAPTTAVPLSAVVRDGTRSFVFVRQKDGAFERRAIETSDSDDRRVAVRRGLAEGETIAVTGTEALQTAHAAVR